MGRFRESALKMHAEIRFGLGEKVEEGRQISSKSSRFALTEQS